MLTIILVAYKVINKIIVIIKLIIIKLIMTWYFERETKSKNNSVNRLNFSTTVQSNIYPILANTENERTL